MFLPPKLDCQLGAVEREAATLSGLVGSMDGFPRVGPQPPFPPAIQPGLMDAIPSGLAKMWARLSPEGEGEVSAAL